METTLVVTTQAGDEVPGRLINLLALKGDRAYQLSVGGPQDLLDRLDVDAMLCSFRVG